ncbi:hypothetical protein O3S80_51070, partial [Streptomyces sp. Lzd4kr]|nr:hypothetical protein [Streptomyces sp. Lzd4kr]
MSVDQLPARMREFVNYLDGLTARLDQGGGWCGVFWQRDPEGMRACLAGREVPPWDVVESLLQDLAGQYGPGGAGPETERARALHAAALAAYDARPGGRDAIGDRLDVMLREQRYAAERQAELSRSLIAATSRDQAEAIQVDLAWARDDHERATARCAELRFRMTDLDRRAASARERAIQRDRFGEGHADGGSAADPAEWHSRAGAPEGPGPVQERPAGPYAAENAARVPDEPDTRHTSGLLLDHPGEAGAAAAAFALLGDGCGAGVGAGRVSRVRLIGHPGPVQERPAGPYAAENAARVP